MSKRNADEEDIEYHEKILRRLRANQRRKVRVIRSDSPASLSFSEGADGGRKSVTTNHEVYNPPLAVHNQPPAADLNTTEVSDLEPDKIAVSSELMTEFQPQVTNGLDPEIDPKLLEALGETTCDTPKNGPKILDKLVDLCLPILRKGMSEDSKEKMLKDYLIPDNCGLLQSPKLNPEISEIAKVSNLARDKDNTLMSQQQQLGSGITAVIRTLEFLLKGDNTKEAIYHLSNACRILSDLHGLFTKNRIKSITSNLDKNFLHVVQNTERDETLFGTNLSNKIKEAKDKHGELIRQYYPPRISRASRSASDRTSTTGNWNAYSRYQMNRGGQGNRDNRGSQYNRQYGNLRYGYY